MNSARSLVRGLQRARDECGWDLGRSMSTAMRGVPTEDRGRAAPDAATTNTHGQWRTCWGTGRDAQWRWEREWACDGDQPLQSSPPAATTAAGAAGTHDERHRSNSGNHHQGTNGYDHDSRNYMSEDTPTTMVKGSSAGTGTGTNWQMSIEELFPEIFSDFTDSALFDGPSYG